MSRRRRERYNEDANAQSLAKLLYKPPAPVKIEVIRTPPPVDLRLLSDRRQFYPTILTRPAGSVVRGAERLKVPKTYKPQLPTNVQFQTPKKVAICMRRKERREVLFAKALTKKAGRGGWEPPSQRME